jgi:hypothetical protein
MHVVLRIGVILMKNLMRTLMKKTRYMKRVAYAGVCDTVDTVDRLFARTVHADDPAAADECPMCLIRMNKLALRVSPMIVRVSMEIGMHHIARCRACQHAMHACCLIKAILSDGARGRSCPCCPCCRGAL